MSTAHAPYEALAGIIERELELVSQGRFEELDQLRAELAELVATLPPVPPSDARAALERSALLQQRVTMELLRSREALLLSLANLERARRAARGYTPPQMVRARVYASA